MRDIHTFFGTFFSQTLNRFPYIGKLLTSIFGLLELPILEFVRRIDKKLHLKTKDLLNSLLLKGRWGGRVVPLNKNIAVDTKFAPTQEILEIVSRSKIAKISYCYCRTIQRATNSSNCDHPLYTCIHLSYGKALNEIADKSIEFKNVSKQEVIDLLEECDKRGLVHQLIYFPNPDFYYVICNCCPCCCVVLNNYLKEGLPRVIKSDFVAHTDLDLCNNCGECVEWCHFGARTFQNGKLQVNGNLCFGCGICGPKCPQKAIKLIKNK